MEKTRALISVSDKTGIVDFARQLAQLNVDIISTGGTANVLSDAGIAIKEVSEVTGFPEILDGRVKTLHPVIHAGVLAKRETLDHMDVLKKHSIDTIDIVICNLYPFEKTIQQPGVSIEEVIENIDIGGPTLLRAAAKNYRNVIVVTNPQRYDAILELLSTQKEVDLKYREQLAVEAFAHTAQYDAIISHYLCTRWLDDRFPASSTLSMRKIQDMRYGENPHQHGAFYHAVPPVREPCVANTRQLQGKELSFNNILDIDCAIECIKEFQDPTCVIIKHATPCGIASASTVVQAWKDAYATDHYSPFGGIVSFNRIVTEALAQELSDFFLEVIIAPEFSKESLALFGKKKNLRLLTCTGLNQHIERNGLTVRSVVGGYLVQDRDIWLAPQKNWKVVTKQKPSAPDRQSMEFAVKCVRHIKSNSVLFVKDTRTVAIGGGQTSRVDATWIATHKGKEHIKGSIMASDAFFPFRDAVDVAAKAGVKAVIQPGGSIRDKEVIEAADDYHLAMVFTGQRYFRH